MRSILVFAVSLVFVLGCTDRDLDGPGGVQLTNGSFSGTVNGATYAPLVVNITQTATTGGTIVAFGAADANNRGLGWAFVVNGTGTYSMGQNNVNVATFIEGTSTWNGIIDLGGNGTLTLTTVTSTRVAGSFSLTLVPSTQTTAIGTKTISGTFDIVPSS
jgi:hypothetical protein